MNQKAKLNLCIQAHPNELGVEYGRIALSDDLLHRWVVQCKIVDAYKLFSCESTLTQVTWYASECVLLEEVFTTCSFWGGECDEMWILSIEGHYSGQRNELGVFEGGCTIQGSWLFNSPAELDRANLESTADSHGDIHVTNDLGALLESSSRSAQYYRAIYQSRRKNQLLKTNRQEHRPWPDPFDRWNTHSHDDSPARMRLPRKPEFDARSDIAEATLQKLFTCVLTRDLDPNERCAFYTLTAALMICPKEVTLTRFEAGIPQFLNRDRYQGALGEESLHIDDVSAMPQKFCGTCNHEFEFERTIRIRYRGIQGDIQLDAKKKVMATSWSTLRQVDDLALLYEDSLSNNFALKLMQEFASQYTDDVSRLRLLAIGLDALKRLMDHSASWFEDARASMENKDSWYGTSPFLEKADGQP